MGPLKENMFLKILPISLMWVDTLSSESKHALWSWRYCKCSISLACTLFCCITHAVMPPSGEQENPFWQKRAPEMESMYFIFPCGPSSSLLPEPVEMMCRKKEKSCNCNLQAHRVDKLSNLSRCGRKHCRTDGLMQCGRRLKPGRSEQRCQVTALNTHSGEKSMPGWSHRINIVWFLLFFLSLQIVANAQRTLLSCCRLARRSCTTSSMQEVSRTRLGIWTLQRAKAQTHTDTHTCGARTFLILCFGPVWSQSHGNRARRGEESVRRLAELHPSGSPA